MDKARQGEIALELVRYFIRKQGLKISREVPREIGNVAKEIGIPASELTGFLRPLVQEAFNECFEGKSE